MLSEIEFKAYFKEAYPELNLTFINDEKIVVENSNLNKMVLPLMHNNRQDFKEGRGWEGVIDHNQIQILNSNLNIFPDVGYRFQDALEVIFTYTVTDYENGCDSNTIHCNVFDLWEFNIGDYKVKVDHPSDMFKLLFKDYETDDFFVGWEAYNTILIEGVKSDDLQNILQQAMFWIYQMCPSVYDISFPEISSLCYEDSEGDIEFDAIPYAKTVFNEEYENLEFALSNYDEPIYFYNAAKRINDIDISFLYFYKILEFFFIIIQKNSIKKDVELYFENENLEKLIDDLHNNYFGKREESLLYSLIDRIETDIITEVRELAFNNHLIRENTNKEFSNQMYQHRNSIVHGKFEFKNFKLKLPNKIDDYKSMVWTEIIEKVTFYLIRTNCYNK